jgi:GAF domain-containing protein/CheY-like chemotaxis protein
VHDTLKKQLLEHYGSLDKIPAELRPLFDSISQTYQQAGIGGAGMERAARLTSAASRRELRIKKDAAGEVPGEARPPRNGDTPAQIAVPIEIRGQSLGALNLNFDDPAAAQTSAPLIQQISTRLALAMENARLFEETQISLNRTDALLRVSRAAVSEDTPTLLNLVAQTLADLLHADRVILSTFNLAEASLTYFTARGPGAASSAPPAFAELNRGAAAQVIRDRQTHLHASRAEGAQIIVPIIAREQAIGLIEITNQPDQPELTAQDAELASALANQIATAIENARLVEEQGFRLQELTTLLEGSQTFSTAPTELLKAAETILRYYLRVSGATTGALAFSEFDTRIMRYQVVLDGRKGQLEVLHLPAEWHYHFSEFTYTIEVLQGHRPVALRLDDPATPAQERKLMETGGFATHTILPLVSKGQHTGIVELEFADPTVVVTADQLALYQTLANQAAAVLDNIRLLDAQQQRALELQTAAEVSRAASSILNPNELLPRSVELIRERFNLYYAGIFLVDETREWAILRAGTGDAGRIQLQREHKLRLGGESMIGRCIATGEAQIALDVGEAATRFQNPVLPNTRSEMALPLISRGQTLGAMTIQSERAGAFSPENINTLQTMADQLANAIENARLFAQAQLQNLELDTLNEMGRELTSLLDRDAIIASVHDYTARLLEFTSFLLAIYNPETETISLPYVTENNERITIPPQPLGSGLAAYIIRNGAPLLIPEDLPGEAAKLGISYVTVGDPTLSWLGVPIFVGGRVHGVISVQTTTVPRLYNERNRDLLISIANQAANAFQISQLFAQAQEQNRELATLNEMSRALSLQLSVDDVIEEIYRFSAQLLGTPNGFIALYDDTSGMIDFKLAVTDEGRRLTVPSRRLGTGMTDYVIHSRQPLLFKENVQQEMDEKGLTGITIGDPPKSWLAVPISLGDRVIGVIGTQSVTTPRKFNERHRDVLVSVSGQAAIALQNASLFEQSRRQNEELAVLNEMSRELSTQLDDARIVDNLYAYTSRLIGSPNVFIALYEEDTQVITFPIAVDDGQKVQVPTRILGDGLTDYVIRTRQPLLLNENADVRSKEIAAGMVTIGEPPESWLGVPIILGERTLGMIGAQSVRTPRRYQQRHVDLLTSITGQAAISLQNARLFAQAQQQTADLATLNEMSRVLATQVEIPRILETIHEFTRKFMEARNFFVAFYDARRAMLTIPYVTIGEEMERIQLPDRSLKRGMTDYVVREKKPLLMTARYPEFNEEYGIEQVLFGNDKPAQSWLGVPMLVGGEVIGVITVQTVDQPGIYRERHRDLLTAIANQAVTAIQNARSFEQSQQQSRELADLNDLARALSQTLDVAEIVRQVHQIASRLVDTSNFYLALYEQEADEIEFKIYTDAGKIVQMREPKRRGGSGMTEYVIRSGKTLFIEEDVDAKLVEIGIEAIGKSAQSWIGVPMKIGDTVLGVISIQDYETPGKFTRRDQSLLEAVASQTAIALQNAYSFEQAQRQSGELAVLNEMGRVLTTTTSVQQVVETVYEYTSRLMDTTSFFVAFLDETTETISFPLVYTGGSRFEGLADRKLGKGMTDYVLRNKEPLLLSNFSMEEASKLGIELILFGNNKPAQSWLGVPLLIGGQILGAIAMQSVTTPGLYRERHRDLLTSISNQAANAIQNARLFEQTRQQNDDLSVLNEMSRVLSSTLSVGEVVDSVYEYTSRVLDTSVFHMVLYDEVSNTISYPLVVNHGKKLSLKPRAFGNKGLTEHVIVTRQPLLFEQDVPGNMERLGLETVFVGDQDVPLCWMGVPMAIGARVIGTLSLQSVTTPQLFGPYERDLLTSIAGQTAIAIQNARLFEQTQQQLADLTIIQQTMAGLTASIELESTVESVLPRILEAGNADVVSMYMVEGDEIVRLGMLPKDAVSPEGGERLPLTRFALAREVVETGKSRRASLGEKGLPKGVRENFKAAGVTANAIIPLVERDNVIGVFSVSSRKPEYSFSEHDLGLLETLASQSAIGIQNAQLFRQTQDALSASTEQAQRLSMLNQMSTELSLAEDLEQLFDLIVRHAAEIFDADRASIGTLVDAKTIEIRAVAGGKAELAVGTRLPVGGTANEVAIRSRSVQINPETDQREPGAIRSFMVAPVVVQGEVIGTLNVGSAEPYQYERQDENLLIQLVSIAGAVITNRRLFTQIQESLSATESLYNASAQLNQAQSFDDILHVLQEFTLLGTDSLNISLNMFDRPWTKRNQPETIEVIARVTSLPAGSFQNRYPLALFPSASSFLHADKPWIFEGFTPTESMDPQLRSFFVDGLGARSGIVAPLVVRGNWVGFVLSYYRSPRRFPEDGIQQLMSVIGQAAVAVQGLQSLELAQQRADEANRRSEELATVNRIVAQVAETFDLRSGLQYVADELGKAVGVGRVGVALLNEDREALTLVVDYYADPKASSARGLQIPVRGNESTLWVMENRRSLFIRDAQSDPIIAPLHETFKRYGIRSLVIIPLLARNEVIGTVGLDILEADQEFSEEQLRLAETIVLQAANAIQNARLFDETRKRAAQLQTAAEVARDASQSLNPDELLPRAVNFVRDRFGYYHASIFLLDEAAEYAVVRASTGVAGQELIRREHRLAVGSQSIIGSVTYTGEPLIINDVSLDPIHRPNPLLPDTRAELGMPLKIGDRVIGALDVQSTEVNAFSADDQSVLRTLADQLAVAVDNSRTFALAQQAFQEARSRVQELTTLFDVSQSLTSAQLQPTEIAETAVRTMINALGNVSSCSLAIYDRNSGLMRTYADIALTDGSYQLNEAPSIWDFPLADFPYTRGVMDSLQPAYTHFDDPNADPAELAYLKSVGAKTLLIIPLAVKGESFGIMELETWDHKRDFTSDQLNLAMTISNQCAAAIDNALLYEEQLRTAEQLRELDTLKNQFLANMSHELRTPLNSIIGFSRVILKGIDGPVTDLQSQDLTAIYNAGQHLLGLINDILDLSRIEAGKMELNFEELNLETLITSVLSTARGLVKEKSIRLEQTIEADLPAVYADATRVRQVLLNLLQNAAKFTDHGYIHVRAAVETQADKRRFVRVSVEDTGVGIALEDQQKLFQPFSQVDSSTTRKVGGTGLGLSISRNLIELHGGTIQVESQVGRGSTFYFTLPIREQTQHVAVDSSRKVVLAIDDDPRVIELYERYLSGEGYQVIPLHDPLHAVDQAIALKPFAITLDVMMPNRNGWQVMEALKANEQTRDIPVIFCTIIEDEAKGFSLGAADYLMKPILEEDLLNALGKIQERRQIHNILVIDDSPDDLRLVEKILSDYAAFNIHLADGGEAGLAQIRSNTPDLIILDLSMPEIDGFKILEALQENDHLKQIPVIVLTGQDLNANQYKYVSTYAQKLFLKGSLKEQELLSSLEEQLHLTGND